MKESEFIELLNLYLDHEISAVEATRLEAEVGKNPARRRLYEDYCRMQKACKILGAELAEANRSAGEEKLVRFEPATTAHGNRGWLVGTGALAAAACLTVIFFTDRQTVEPVIDSSTEVAVAESAAVIPEGTVPITNRNIPRTVSMPVAAEEPKAGIASTLSLGGIRQSSERPLFVGGDRSAPEFDWIATVEVTPMQRAALDEFKFANQQSFRREIRPTVPRPSNQGPMEWNAIRWQK